MEPTKTVSVKPGLAHNVNRGRAAPRDRDRLRALRARHGRLLRALLYRAGHQLPGSAAQGRHPDRRTDRLEMNMTRPAGGGQSKRRAILIEHAVRDPQLRSPARPPAASRPSPLLRCLPFRPPAPPPKTTASRSLQPQSEKLSQHRSRSPTVEPHSWHSRKAPMPAAASGTLDHSPPGLPNGLTHLHPDACYGDQPSSCGRRVCSPRATRRRAGAMRRLTIQLPFGGR